MQIEVIDPGETLWIISRRYGVSVDELAEVNGLDPQERLVIGQALVVPVTGSWHIVAAGESLWTIARRYGVSPQTLASINGITNPSLLYPGQRLRIPQAPRPVIEANAYLQPGGTERDAELVREVSDDLTYVSVFQYRVTRTGELVPPRDEQALQAIREGTARPMMVITNFEEGNFSADIARSVFDSDEVRDRLIDNVLAVMQAKGFVALNIDFEHVYPEDRDRYTAFLRTITERMHEGGYLVSTALAPKLSGTQAGPWYAAHDYGAHGAIADFVIIMTYEWGWSGGPPMPVAPIPQVRRVLEYALTVIPRDKIVMGAPLYGYNWTLPYVPGGKFAPALSPQGAVDLARRVGANIQYDAAQQAPFFRYWDQEGKEHIVWFEDARSMQAKFDLIKEYGLRGISYWVLGHRFPQNWALLAANFTIRKL